MALGFSIIRHPHFVVVKNLFSGVGGNIDVDSHLLFKGHKGQGVKVKRISFVGWDVKNYIVIKEGDENGPLITRLGSEPAGVPRNCYFKNGGSVMQPFIDVSECGLSGGLNENRIIFDFVN